MKTYRFVFLLSFFSFVYFVVFVIFVSALG
jgi:hypothetical protein